MDLRTRQDIARFLITQRTLTLATTDEVGTPHAASLWFVADDHLRLHWVSSEASTHSRHLRVRPDAAVTVHAAVDDPRLIHGLQMHGRAAAVLFADRDAVLNLYIERFPFAADPPYRDALDRQEFNRFTPTWLRWIDNRRGFGFAVEENIAADQRG